MKVTSKQGTKEGIEIDESYMNCHKTKQFNVFELTFRHDEFLLEQLRENLKAQNFFFLLLLLHQRNLHQFPIEDLVVINKLKLLISLVYN